MVLSSIKERGKEEMKPRIRKKGLNTDQTNRYILEYIKNGEFKTIALNPEKLVKILDSPNVEKNHK